jgi:hypothetical protein
MVVEMLKSTEVGFYGSDAVTSHIPAYDADKQPHAAKHHTEGARHHINAANKLDISNHDEANQHHGHAVALLTH